jgi:protein O-mannosyl-transferase
VKKLFCSSKNISLLTAFVAAVICLIVYLKALSCGFINFDDPQYVIENTGIRGFDGEFWYWAFATVPLNYWVPLLWISYAIDYKLWGLNPVGYHLTNIALHAVNTGLVVLIAKQLCDKIIVDKEIFTKQKYLYPMMLLLAGLLFGIHPARVESVVWVSERKDVLNGMFTLGAIFFYLQFLQDREEKQVPGAGRNPYLYSLFLFVLSLMAKPSSIVLPVALLIVDWYPLDRLRKEGPLKVLGEKIPYLVVALSLVAISVLARAHAGGFNSLASFPLAVRLVASGNSIVEYFWLMIWPVGILPYYHLPRPVPLVYILKAVLAVGSLCCIVLVGRKKLPWLVASILFFVVSLLPSLHFFADGDQLILAARYTYLPSILPSIIVAAMIANCYLRAKSAWPRYGGKFMTTLVISLLVCYVAAIQQQMGDWINSESFWSKVIAHQPFDKAYFFRGQYRAEQGDYAAAIEDYSTCLSLAAAVPTLNTHNFYAFRGDSLVKAGFYDEAIADFNVAISMFPHKLYFYHRARAFMASGKKVAAAEDLKIAGAESGPIVWLESGK